MIKDHIQKPTIPVISRRHVLLNGGAACAAAMFVEPRAAFAEPNGISRVAESIHQEIAFSSNRNRIYQALTEAKRFDRVVQLSGVMQSVGLAQLKKPTQISAHNGGMFSIFGGYISGRQIELIPKELIVQAWRVGNWDPGVYSIARFSLIEHGAGTTIKFDHAGFPIGQADHLAAGWQANYWEPLRKYLAEG
jgi:activator of HSP90 ATPase